MIRVCLFVCLLVKVKLVSQWLIQPTRLDRNKLSLATPQHFPILLHKILSFFPFFLREIVCSGRVGLATDSSKEKLNTKDTHVGKERRDR